MNRQNTTDYQQRIKKATEKPLVTIAFLLVVLGGYRPAHAIGTHNSNVTPASAYTEFAELFPSVGGLFTFSDTAPDNFGSGVLIHPNFVLTAGHVALTNDGDPTSFYDDFQFVLGANTSTEATEFQFADEVFLAPGYDGIEQGVDLALLYFETPFTSVAPAQRYDQRVQAGDESAIVGFGQTGDPVSGLVPGIDGVKRAAENIITEESATNGGYAEYRFRNENHPDFLALGGQGLLGDSGSGWFIESEDEFYLFGISSSGEPNPRYGADTSAFEILLASTFIDETIASKTAVPEPTSMALLGIGGLIGAARRRKRQA